MDKLNRMKKLEEIKKNQPSRETKRISYQEPNKVFDVYEIPLGCLIANQENGRIATFVKTYEKTNESINASEGAKLIEDFLWKSNINRNKDTLEDLKIKGQMEAGVVTRDGVIIDGNRRFMLLKKLAQSGIERHFRAVILDIEVEGNASEVNWLETIFQEDVDEKVHYNPIEKYLKCRKLKEYGKTEKQISEIMYGETETKIKNYLGIMELLDQYLEHIDARNIYTHLEKEQVEGPIVDLYGALKRRARDWDAETDDLEDFKYIVFDYIRAGFKADHGLRRLTERKGVFNYKDLWKSAMDRHIKIEKISESEESTDSLRLKHPEDKIEDLIKLRNDNWQEQAGRPGTGPRERDSILNENLRECGSRLERRIDENKPYNLLSTALTTLAEINIDKLREKKDEDPIWETCTAIKQKIEDLIKALDE